MTRKALCTPDVIERMEPIGNKASQLFVKLMRVFSEGQKRMYGWPGAPVHDATCVAYLIDPTFMEAKDMFVEVDLSHGPSYGRTNCDAYFIEGDKTTNARVCIGLDTEKFGVLLSSACVILDNPQDRVKIKIKRGKRYEKVN